jgi:hypothetical protein
VEQAGPRVSLFLEGVTRLGDAEVGDLHLAFPRDKDVLWAHVAVDDAERSHLLVAPPVGMVEPLGHLGCDVDAHAGRERQLEIAASRKKRRQVEPGHVLHGMK